MVQKGMQAGILKEGDPEETSVTMWAHAHGKVQLYRKGYFRLDETEFRRQFEESGARMMAGMATPALVAEIVAGRTNRPPLDEPVTHTGGEAE